MATRTAPSGTILRVARRARRGGRGWDPVRSRASQPPPPARHQGPLRGLRGPGPSLSGHDHAPAGDVLAPTGLHRGRGHHGRSAAHTYRQLWHLTEDARPFTSQRRTWTRRDTGNLLIWQLDGGVATRTLTGRRSPIQGWISRSYGQRAPAPVIEQRLRGQQVRFLTLLAPYGAGTGTGRPPVSVSDLTLTPHGFSMTVGIEGSRETVRATEHMLSITDAPTTTTDDLPWE